MFIYTFYISDHCAFPPFKSTLHIVECTTYSLYSYVYASHLYISTFSFEWTVNTQCTKWHNIHPTRLSTMRCAVYRCPFRMQHSLCCCHSPVFTWMEDGAWSRHFILRSNKWNVPFKERAKVAYTARASGISRNILCVGMYTVWCILCAGNDVKRHYYFSGISIRIGTSHVKQLFSLQCRW